MTKETFESSFSVAALMPIKLGNLWQRSPVPNFPLFVVINLGRVCENRKFSGFFDDRNASPSTSAKNQRRTLLEIHPRHGSVRTNDSTAAAVS